LENVDIFYGHLEYFMNIWDILQPFGTFCVNLVHFSGFGIMHQEKSGNPVGDVATRKEMPVVSINKAVDKKIIIGKSGLRRRRGTNKTN
jgi:hypothetical protein